MSKNHKKINILPVILIVLIAIGAVAVMVWPDLPSQLGIMPTAAATEPAGSANLDTPVASTNAVEGSGSADSPVSGTSTTPGNSTTPGTSGEAGPGASQSATEATNAQIQPQVQTPINLGSGLEITDSGKYTGLYMEDGSNALVSDVMMVVVCNNGEQDVQFASFTAVSGKETYRFQLTNLAAGEKVVLLDLDQKKSGDFLTSAAMDQVVLFQEPMSVYADRIQISSMDGMMNVKNISNADITDDIYVYYKYAAQDLYYGGITFRVRVEGGLKAGEIRQVLSQHHTAKGCAIVQVTIHE